jgi:hypothetical protein
MPKFILINPKQNLRLLIVKQHPRGKAFPQNPAFLKYRGSPGTLSQFLQVKREIHLKKMKGHYIKELSKRSTQNQKFKNLNLASTPFYKKIKIQTQNPKSKRSANLYRLWKKAIINPKK